MNKTIATLMFLTLAGASPALAEREPVWWRADGFARVVDGDTLHMEYTVIRSSKGSQSWREAEPRIEHDRTFQLRGIDAPELDQFCELPDLSRWECGVSAQAALGNAIAYGEVTCFGGGEQANKGPHGRSLAECYVWSNQRATPTLDLDRPSPWQQPDLVDEILGRVRSSSSYRWLHLNNTMVLYGWAVVDPRHNDDEHREANQQIATEERWGIWQSRFQPPWEWRQDQEWTLEPIEPGEPAAY